MPAYTPTTWVNGVTAANAAHMTNIENQLSAVQYGLNMISPYQLLNNVTINNGATNTPTCTGVGGVPSGAKAVLMNIGATSTSATGFATLVPHGSTWSSGVNYPATQFAPANGSVIIGSSLIVPLDSSGKIDISAVNSNLTAVNAYMYGYIY